MDLRSEVLRGARLAAELSRWHPDTRRTSFDVIGAISARDIPIMCQRLDGLQGATITVEGEQGVLLNSATPFSKQRFTLAHELGHVLLGHENKFDAEVGQWIGRQPSPGDVEEVAADTFAGDLLAPRHRIVATVNRHKWGSARLRDPSTVYQLSLRLGMSYHATCVALSRTRLIDRNEQRALEDVTVQDLKRQLVGDDLEDSWGDVWNLNLSDMGSLLEAGPTDVFRFNLVERASAGYLWSLETPSTARVVEQGHLPLLEYGASQTRELRLFLEPYSVHEVRATHKRPWNHETIEIMSLTVETWGKERGGVCRRQRELRIEAVAA